jgi:hypothetical protein
MHWEVVVLEDAHVGVVTGWNFVILFNIIDYLIANAL